MSCADNACFLSVIIPVYNAETTLRKTVDSVLAAQIKNMEILLVDDGSTDNSPQICDQYAQKYSHIKVIHQSNTGPSAARNAGIAAVEGDYCFFLDGDDTVHIDLFKHFLDYKDTHDPMPDIIAFNAQKLHAITEEIIPIGVQPLVKSANGLDGVSAIKTILEADPLYEWYAWRYFYSINYLRERHFCFLAGRYYEDVEWTPRVLLEASSFGYMDVLGVNYLYQNSSSILNTPSLKKSQDKIEIAARMFRYTDEHVSDKQLSVLLKNNFSRLYLSAFGDYLNGSAQLYDPLRQNVNILRYEKTRFGRLARVLCQLFGFRFGTALLKTVITVMKRGTKSGE